MFKRYAEVADQFNSSLINLLPKAPTPAEYIDAALEANKLWAKVVQDELTNVAKTLYKFN